MKIKKKILFLAVLFSPLLSGCNDLKKDRPAKSGISLFDVNNVPKTYQVYPEADSMTAFLWPSKQYFNYHKGRGLINDLSYQSFIARVSEGVFLSGDLFDEYGLHIIELDKSIAEIEKLKQPIIKTISKLSKKIKGYKKDFKRVKKNKKTSKRKKINLTKSKKKFVEEDLKLLKEFEALLCIDVLNRQVGENLKECKSLDLSLEALKIELVKVNQLLSEILLLINQLDEEMVEIKKNIDFAFSFKKKVTQEELRPLQAEVKIASREKNKKSLFQAEMLLRVQEALDPHAIQYEFEEDGVTAIFDENNFRKRYIVKDKQVNWIETYEETAKQSNTIRFEGHIIHIQFKHWGKFKTHYQTSYQRDGEGQVLFDDSGGPLLDDRSDFVMVKQAASDVIEFHMLEKEINGELTGRVFEFKLQRAFFHLTPQVSLLGDIVVRDGDRVVRRGQTKIIFLQKEE